MAATVITRLNLNALTVLGNEDMTWFCNIIEERAGINMPASKHDLVRSRLKSHLREFNFETFEEYKELLKKLPPDDYEWQVFINLLTTNKTDFFREPKHFDFLINNIIPEWSLKNEQVFKVWSAAASTGEEPYTLAMVLHKHLPKNKDFLIVATDIDTNVLQKGMNAVYSDKNLIEIPAEYKDSSLDIGRGKMKGWFRIKKEIKDKIIFKTHNLIGPLQLPEAPFDLVVCRNVLIYFTQDNIDFVQEKLYAHTKLNGHFFIGHSESLYGIVHNWASIRPAVYKKDR